MANCKLISKHEAPNISAIADECFGKGYVTVEQIKKHSHKGIFLGIYKDDELVGVCQMNIAKAQNALGIPLSLSKKLPLPIAIFKTLAVHPDHQHKGYGSILLKHGLELLETYQLPILYILWKEGERAGFAKRIKNLGFTPFADIKNYWLNDSLKKNYHCKRCGPPPCKCSATFYIKWLQNHQ